MSIGLSFERVDAVAVVRFADSRSTSLLVGTWGVVKRSEDFLETRKDCLAAETGAHFHMTFLIEPCLKDEQVKMGRGLDQDLASSAQSMVSPGVVAKWFSVTKKNGSGKVSLVLWVALTPCHMENLTSSYLLDFRILHLG